MFFNLMYILHIPSVSDSYGSPVLKYGICKNADFLTVASLKWNKLNQFLRCHVRSIEHEKQIPSTPPFSTTGGAERKSAITLYVKTLQTSPERESIPFTEKTVHSSPSLPVTLPPFGPPSWAVPFVSHHIQIKSTPLLTLFDWYLNLLDRICGLVVRVPGYRSTGPCSIPGTIRFSVKQWVWNRVHSASWVQLRSYLEEKVAAPV
jgi:hypothetical protein